MYRCVFERQTGVCVSSGRQAELTYNPVTEVLIELPNDPDRRTERWDGADGVRAATAQELADYDDAEDDRAGRADIDENRAFKALAWEVAERFGVDVDVFRDSVFDKYQRLRRS